VGALAWLALVGVLHVHHDVSHDSAAPFSAVLEAALAADLDFLVLTEHANERSSGALPASERAGFYPKPDGSSLLVLVGVELGTAEGHLVAYGIRELMPSEGRPAREVVDAIHAQGGFAVVSHPFTHGGWHGWSIDFDGLEVHNGASALRRAVGPLLPLRLLRFAVDRPGAWRSLLQRPARELARWDELLAAGRRVFAYSGADAHQNLSLAGWQLDPYAEVFRNVQTWCPDGPLAQDAIWTALRTGQCWIHYAIFEGTGTPQEVVFGTGRRELQLSRGARVLEIHQPRLDGPRSGGAILPADERRD
jgi:hypothetical protein